MAKAIQAVPAAKPPVAINAPAYVAGPVYRCNPVAPFEQPRPASNAKGTLSNARLRKLAKKHRPPQQWYEGDEEQLF